MVFKQDLDELKHVFLICAEFEVKSISMQLLQRKQF